MAYTSNPATFKAEFRNSVGSLPVRGNNPLTGGVDCVTTCNPAQGEKFD